jgi:hypothetical protein
MKQKCISLLVPSDQSHTDTLPSEVQLESFVALTSVAPRRWNATAILTEIADQLTVISDIEWQHP